MFFELTAALDRTPKGTNLDHNVKYVRWTIAMQTIEAPVLKHWTAADYHRMSEFGILKADERTELIAGQILSMAAKGTPHVTTLRLLAVALDTLLGVPSNDRSFFVSTQDPIQLDDFSEPEPDLTIVRGKILDFTDRHPGPGDIVLVVEVADSTLKYDCEVKDNLYARAEIEDYWVVNVKKRQLHIFRHPTPSGYTSHLILSQADSIAPLAFPDRIFSIADIFV